MTNTGRDFNEPRLQNALPDGVDIVQWRIACYARDLSTDDISAAAFAAARALVIDTTGVLIAAFPSRFCADLRALAPNVASGPTASLVGSTARTTLGAAAFVNASTARYLEGNDVYARYKPGAAHGHPSDVILPLLAVAESVGASGRDFLAAVVVAYEVYLRICDACHSEGFDATVFGGIGVAAAAGRLFGLSTQGIAQAVSMAACAHNILKQVRTDRVTPWKALAAGVAGRTGVESAELAKAGFAGPSLPFHGASGWCEHVAKAHFDLAELDKRNPSFLICDSRIKTRPARALTIAATLAAEKLAGRVTDVETVARITVATYRNAKNGSKAEHWIADNRETADHSIPYCVAAALLFGELTPESFDVARLNDARLRVLMSRLEVVEDEAMTQAYIGMPQQHQARVTVVSRDGATWVGQAGGDEDDLASPKSPAWVQRKFARMVIPILGERRTAEMYGLLMDLLDVAALDEIIASSRVGV